MRWGEQSRKRKKEVRINGRAQERMSGKEENYKRRTRLEKTESVWERELRCLLKDAFLLFP